jgi:hypothetical protein
MIIRISVISILMLFILASTADSKVLRTNYDIMDSLARSLSEEAINFSSCSSGDSIRLIGNQNSASWLIDQYLISESIRRGIVVFDSAQVYIGLTVNVTEAKTIYSTVPDDDMKFIREVNLGANIILRDKLGQLSQMEDIIRKYQDTLALEDIKKVGDSPYDFAHAEIPPEEPTFWQKALEPAVLIVSGAIIVYLLFTVRSN